MNTRPLSNEQVAQFARDGYLIVPNLFDAEEIALLRETARRDHVMLSHGFGVKDTTGRETKLSLWNTAGDDIYGVIARCRRVVDSMEQLLGGEVYHYHSKMSIKEPHEGGAWEWHQDYGYWYQNGCLFPDMASVFIAVDASTRENGCLQVLRGSHRMGRIEHGRYGDQTGADPERVAAACERMETVYCVLNPGDACFFHSNTLHRSDANNSDEPRWSLLCCYNAASNDPYKDSHHPRYTPLEKVDDSMVKLAGARGSAEAQDFLDPARDRTTAAGKK